MGGYFPNINVKTSEIDKYNITDYNNLKEVKQKIYDYYKDNYNNTNSTANYYYLEHPVTIDGVDYIVNMDIRKVPDSNGRFYIYSISENIAQKKVGTKGNQNGRLLKVVPTYGNNISQSNNTVKSSTSVKHSIEENNNKTWREHLTENYEATGTRTYMPDYITDDYDFAIDGTKDNKSIALVDVDDQGINLAKGQI